MKRKIFTAFCGLCILAVFLSVFFFPPQESVVAQGKTVLEIWHVDSFEGGKGSRAAFLRRTAREYAKKDGNVYVLVSAMTEEGAKEKLKKGEEPDLFSFSCGMDGVIEHAIKLDDQPFSGGKIGKDTYAVPWAAGQYFYFSLKEDFSALSDASVLLSKGGNNLPAVVAALSTLNGQTIQDDSTSAYVRFLSGKADYLLGTQRDVCRFNARGVNVYTMPVTNYNDLYQYIAVTSQGNVAKSKAFIRYLLGDSVQGRLKELGLDSAKEVKAEYTLSPFTEKEKLAKLEELAKNCLAEKDVKILKNFLKPLN